MGGATFLLEDPQQLTWLYAYFRLSQLPQLRRFPQKGTAEASVLLVSGFEMSTPLGPSPVVNVFAVPICPSE